MSSKTILSCVTVCMSISLAGCGGGVGSLFDRGGGSGTNVQRLIENATNLEMTGRTLNDELGRRTVTVNCFGTTCESTRGQANLSLAYYHDGWLNDGRESGSAHVRDDDNFTFRKKRQLGQHSGYYIIAFFYENTGSYNESFSAAFGGPGIRPISGAARWTGDMGGHETRTGRQLTGRSTVTYSFDDNTVDVVLSDVTGPGYVDDSVFTWEDLQVQSDGSFNSGNDYISGSFYGPNSEETTGVFERDFVAGAWFASRN